MPFWARLVTGLHFSVGVSYAVLIIIFVLQGLTFQADYSSFYTAWRMVLEGQGGQLYDFALQGIYQRDILQGRSFADGLLPFVQPPHVALVLAPFGLLPRAASYLVWLLLQCGLLVWLLLLLRRLTPDWQPHERMLMLSAVVAFPPLLNTLILGAFSLWGLLCIVQFMRLLQRGRDAAAGIWVVLGTTKPHLVLLPGLILLSGRRWSGLLAASITGGGFFLLCSFALGWQIWGEFLGALRESAALFGRYGINPDEMYNIKGALTLWLGADHAALINQASLLALLVVAAGVLWLWRGAWNTDAPDFPLRLALTITLGILFSPHLYPHDSLVMVAPAVLMYMYIRHHQPAQRSRYALFILSWPLAFLVSEFGNLHQLLLFHPQTVLMAVLAGWSLLELRRCSRAQLAQAPPEPAPHA
jgi:hypothetical protein